jgi:hypothetical protein
MQDRLILSDTEQWFEPWFTLHCFRYAEVDGLKQALGQADVEEVEYSIIYLPLGTIQCSDPTEQTEREHKVECPVEFPRHTNRLPIKRAVRLGGRYSALLSHSHTIRRRSSISTTISPEYET